MNPSNRFNKKQKEEIRQIVKSEIREALRKNTKPEINVKNEVEGAIYSILNEKNDDLIKNISEIEDKIGQKETEKSLFAFSIKGLLYGVCVLAWFVWSGFVVATIYLCFTNSYFQENIGSVIVLFIMFFLLVVILVIFSKSIKYMNKNDSYNSLMFIITMIAFIITIFTSLR